MADDSAIEQDIFERDIILEDLKRTLLFSTTDVLQFKSRSSDLTTQHRKFGKLQSKIEKSLMKLKTFNKEEQLKIRNDFSDCYYAILMHVNKFKQADQEGRRMSRIPALALPYTQNHCLNKLPTLPLPTFSGESTDWPSYYDLYRALIHNNDAYTSAEKFRYLLLTLKNEPHNLIKSIPITDENYIVALEILMNRYENRRIIASKHLDRILDIEKCANESNLNLRKLVNVYMENIKALEMMKFPVHDWSFILLNILLRKIPHTVRKRFELSLNKSSDIPTVDILIKFLEQEISTFEIMSNSESRIIEGSFRSRAPSANPHRPSNNSGAGSSGAPRASGSAPRHTFAVTESSDVQNGKRCILCDDQHILTKCSKFLNMSPNDRYNFVKNKNVCYNCLNVGHDIRYCRSNYSCQSCNKRHHTLLHFESKPANSNQACAVSFPPTEEPKFSVSVDPGLATMPMQPTNVNHAMRESGESSIAPLVRKCTIMLSTALVNVCVGSTSHSIRCLIDTGSQASFMTEACSKRLGLSCRYIDIPVFGIGEEKPIQPKGIVSCVVTPRSSDQPAISVEALILPKLFSQFPRIPLPIETWPHIQNLNLADPYFNATNAQPVEMLLGADVLSHILLGNIVKGRPDAPIAMNSIFGYLLMGRVYFDASPCTSSPLQVCHSSFFEDSDLQRFWELEAVPEEKTFNPDERQCESIFENTHSRDENGRYVVALPFKNAPILGQSRDIALARFRKLEYRLERDTSLKRDYHACLQEYLELNQMELCDPPSKDDTSHYYIPHHCVVKESSETTKLRVVFDAACKTTNGKSLNDLLLTGPKLHSDIVDILLNFRVHNIVFTADIKHMYRNIAVRNSDWDYQRIVWRSSPDLPIRDYRLRVVVFGISSSPHAALRVIRQLAHDEADRFPLAAAVLMRDVFVDDVVSGEDSEVSALNLQKQLLGICASAGFELRKWHSNSPAILAAAPSDSHGERPEALSFAEVEKDPSIKVLGLQWNPSSDSFSFKVQTSNSNCTKRVILSEIAKIYDPVGFLAPVILYAKHLMQLLWIAGTGWDESPPIDIVNAWLSFIKQLPLLSECVFPRHIFSMADSIELHGFADASERAYAGCVYIRCKCSDNQTRVFLVLAKTRVAPLKRLSIPRLELMAALLLSQLISKVMLAYGDRIHFHHVYAWSDSTIVLAWLRSSPHEWKTFVSNRTSDILSRVPASCWRHVPSFDNPADSASRGMLPAAFIEHSLWFHGPSWLQTESNTWPVLNQSLNTTEEKRTLPLLANPSSVGVDKEEPEILSKFSSLGKLVRVVAYIFRFYSKCKKIQVTFPRHITVLEYNSSLNRIISIVQQSTFAEDIKNISHGKPPTNQLKRLAPFIDKDNLLRVGGRLHKSLLSFESKHQLILPKKHSLTTLIIDDAHITHLHAGPQSTQYLLLQKYWILSGRDIVRQRIHRCVPCFRARPTHTQPRMAPLPSVRTQSARPFIKTAVDYAGPFYVRANKVRNAKIIKSYVAVFVCMSVKAIHLELVSDLTAEAFLAALRRFTSRRGLCTDIYSDNGKNFVGCSNYLKELYAFLNSDTVQRALHEQTLKQNLTFHFQPVTGSHFCGLVEAGVKSFKHHLHRVIGTRTQTYDEMHTVLCQIEAVLNSRPLCVLSSDSADPLPLTPAHFLIGGPLTALPDISLTEFNTDRLNRWQWVQQCIQHFWKRWSREYLHEIQQAHKWFHDRGPPISEGMIVMVRDDNLPVLQWRLARVHALHPGTDKVIRTVTLRMGNSLTKRPVVKICPIPLN